MINMEQSLSILDGGRLLKELIHKDKETNQNLKDPRSFYAHSIEASRCSYLVSCAFEHQGGDMNVELTRVAALLHDIGKVVATPKEHKKDRKLVFDSIYGARYLEKMDLYKIADVIRPSFTTYEMTKLKSNLFPNINPNDLIPKTPEQEFTVYGDMHSAGSGRHVSFNERMKDIRERYEKSSIIVQSLDIGGEERLRKLNYEVERKAGLII